jgi:hypothetical protein
MNFPGLGPALWKLAITKSFEGIVLLLPLSILLYRAPCLIPHAGNREVTEEADGHEVDCRVLLWDKDRSMIVTIDNRELRWFADCRTSAMLVLVLQLMISILFRRHLDLKEQPLSPDILSSNTSRRASVRRRLFPHTRTVTFYQVPKNQQGSWVTGCESVWMSADCSTFFVGYPTLCMFCEWNSEK